MATRGNPTQVMRFMIEGSLEIERNNSTALIKLLSDLQSICEKLEKDYKDNKPEATFKYNFGRKSYRARHVTTRSGSTRRKI